MKTVALVVMLVMVVAVAYGEQIGTVFANRDKLDISGLSEIVKGITPDEVFEIIGDISPDYEFIRGHFHPNERYFIWKTKNSHFYVSFSKYFNEKWEVLSTNYSKNLDFEPQYTTGGRYFYIYIPPGEYWLDRFGEELNLQGKFRTWFDIRK